jgi:hypothetical protein
MTIKKEKSYDAVKMMREMRDKISLETQNMSLKELNKYIKESLNSANAKVIGTK